MKSTLATIISTLFIASNANAFVGPPGGSFKEPAKLSWADYIADTIGNQDGNASKKEKRRFKEISQEAAAKGTWLYISGIFCAWEGKVTDGGILKTEVTPEFIATGRNLYFSRAQAMWNSRGNVGGQVLQLNYDGTPRRLHLVNANHRVVASYHINTKFDPPQGDIAYRDTVFKSAAALVGFTSPRCVSRSYGLGR